MKTKWKILIALCVVGTIVIINPWQDLFKIYLKMKGLYAEPQFENNESILARAEGADLYYDRLYKLADPQSVFDFQKEGLLSVPFLRIYNARKQNLSSTSGEKCKWSIMSAFEQDPLSSVPGEDTSYNFILRRLDAIDLKTDQDTFDFYVLAGWANYLPRLSDSLFYSTNRIKHSMGARVCMSYLNLDFQEGWEDVFEDK